MIIIELLINFIYVLRIHMKPNINILKKNVKKMVLKIQGPLLNIQES